MSIIVYRVDWDRLHPKDAVYENRNQAEAKATRAAFDAGQDVYVQECEIDSAQDVCDLLDGQPAWATSIFYVTPGGDVKAVY